MKSYPAERIRNIGLFSHGGAGKTSMTEALLFTSKAINRMGRVEDGNTVADWDPDEIKRSMSIAATPVPIEWNGYKINLIDAPGYADLIGEVQAAIRIVDAAVILLDAAAGVEVGTEYAWSAAQEHNLPTMLVVNKMDRENANFESALASAQSILGSKIVPLQVPIGQEQSFSGYVDLLSMQAYQYSDARDGTAAETDMPGDVLDAVETHRLHLVEKIAENDEELMLRYLEDEEISTDELRAALKTAIAAGEIVPVAVSAATTTRGAAAVLDTIVDLLPAPSGTHATDSSGNDEVLAALADAPLAAFVWKTVADPFVGKLTYFRVYSGTMKSDSHVWNADHDKDERAGQLYVIRGKEQLPVTEIQAGDIGAVAKLTETTTGNTLCDQNHKVTLKGIDFPATAFDAAVAPRTKSDLDKLGSSLQRIADEDPTLRVSRDPMTGETIISGLGESHVQIAMERMARKFGVNVDIALPVLAYRETVQDAAHRVEFKHKKQTGGSGQYGHVFIDLEPCEEDFVFEEKIFGGSVPRQYIPGVEKGIREALDEGVLAGFPVVNVKVTLLDGSYHAVDSSEMAFKIASSQAFKKASLAGHPVILEPILSIVVTVPEAFVGDIMGDLTTKRAHVSGMNAAGEGKTQIEATVPAAEVQRYATDLRSLTQGRGSFTTSFSHYQPVPSHLTEAIIAEHKQRLAAVAV